YFFLCCVLLCHRLICRFVFLLPPRSPLFPTRRSSDLYFPFFTTVTHTHRRLVLNPLVADAQGYTINFAELEAQAAEAKILLLCTDRKSTRLNSSHVKISYAVFCLKKKKQKSDTTN